jgi:hypothetical protein
MQNHVSDNSVNGAQLSRRSLLGAVGTGVLVVGLPFAFPVEAAAATRGGDLYFVKTRNTASGRVEVHSATAASGYGKAGVHRATYIDAAEADNGFYELVGSDLYFIKTKNTTSGRIELHSATAASGYTTGGHRTTYLDVAEGDNGHYQLVGSDLYFIKTKNTTSGRIELHSATAASGYQTAGVHRATYIDAAEGGNGFYQVVGSDLYFIKTKNTSSGRIEVHSTTAASGYQKGGIHKVTLLKAGEGDNGFYQMVGSDLYFIKTKNTTSGRVEVHSVTAASGYRSAGGHHATFIKAEEAANGWFQVPSQLESYRAWALNRRNWNGRTATGRPGIEADGSAGARAADLGVAWAQWMGHPSGFTARDLRTVSRPGWLPVPGNLGKARPGDVITRVGGKQHLVVVLAAPAKGVVKVLQQGPGSPSVASYPTSTTGVLWRLG